ncbi:phosphatidylethanolamine N-methyltransferase [Endocarpon pusillum]|uniref:Phosphatidylethanolamine N-methyltransferase n=1 Tax=Endocarpon pusillum TaxID=364733 RepID=A0A8H7AU52_9EURO|nr:phosphatidylethanolamine N-methyltransferase [Endocarpon pusillum]
MNGLTGKAALDTQGLRERNISLQTNGDDEAREAVLHLNALEENGEKQEKDKKTFGRTPDGIVFTVPYTHDMVSQLLSPSEPKNFSDLIVLFILGLHILGLWLLPDTWRVPVFGSVFIFWRASYNLGIGCLLHIQSRQKMLVRWAKKAKIFADPATGQNPHPNLFYFIKRELETKIPRDYEVENAPIEYNTWLVFRRVVDLILMCDFVSYCLFAAVCGGRPAGETALGTAARWVVGWSLVAFNLWVKLDAHRVVKDFAWYWGDFFFLIDQELTFDGVFEMAPHPMYSVGYAGYYGISLMAASYKVLFISIAAHAAQFMFLVWVENPHIERTYNSPPPRRRHTELEIASRDRATSNESNGAPSLLKDGQPSSIHNLLGVQNIDLYRTTDCSVLISLFLIAALTALTPSAPFHQGLFIANAAVWRIWYSVGIGYLLNRQSEKKKWTRHFLKYGDSTEEAWRQWKGTYHLSLIMCYASFAAAAWKVYVPPEDWTADFALLKHVIGFSLIAVQLWVSISIYESLGEFGWFFGDFFFDQSPKLTYSGIYRFLNNPERVLGLAGVWGVALITGNRAIFSLAVLSHVASLAFIQLVERPHMQKLYGRQLRQDAGLVRSLKRSLPPPLRQWQDGMDKVLGETFDYVEDFLDAARPKLAAGVSTMVQDTKDLFNKYPARMSITQVEPDIVGFNPEDYSLEIEGTPSSPQAEYQRNSCKESENARTPPKRTGDFKTLILEYGAPIKVKWRAPANHSKKDWIGLYMVTDNASREVTRISSSGRWIATNPDIYDSLAPEQGLLSSDVESADLQHHCEGPSQQDKLGSGHHGFVSGEVVFSGDKLWWTQGVFEFRYHHNGKHNVMAVSLPFEIRIARFDEDEVSYSGTNAQHDIVLRAAVEKALLPVVRNCFDRDPEIAPDTVDDPYGTLVERDGKFARRVVFAVHQMFGIELAPEVVRADGNVKNLAWRICNAKKVLEPYNKELR